MHYYKIAFQKRVGENNILTYHSEQALAPGTLVSLKLRNKTQTGLLWEKSPKPTFQTNTITPINSVLTPNQITLINWMSEHYFTPLQSLLKTFIPKRVFENKPFKRQPKPRKIPQEIKDKTLTTEQQNAISTILQSKHKTHLLHGITGSGKTEVFTQIAKQYLKKGQQVLILVPEISLTPQTIHYFEQTLQISAATFHSKRSEGEKYHDWQAVQNQEKLLIIGSRSSLFAPFQNLGLIIVDEEHENCYKQENAPRYQLHSVIKKMQQINKNIKTIYASATPKVETTYKLKNHTIHLHQRINQNPLPTIEIVDLAQEFHKKNYSIFSEDLQKAITSALEKKEQIILFINRRGAASSIVCRDCGYAAKCPSCDMKLTYHPRTYNKKSLVCHHCGLITTPPTTCPQCQGPNIRYLGIGTQKVETEAKKMFPSATILRADRDTTSTKKGFEHIYQQMKSHQADILIGTQMIAKGIHLPKVSVVGVILADVGLNIPNYTTTERNYQILTQVAGRAGRADTSAKVIIQTYNPQHIALQCAKQQDYQAFYDQEITQRKLLHYPPFSSLIKLIIEDPNERNILNQLQTLEDLIWQYARQKDIAGSLEINTFPSYILKLRGKYRYNLLIKNKTAENLHPILEKILTTDKLNLTIKIDPEPISIN